MSIQELPKLGMVGANGRMGRAILNLAANRFKITAAIDNYQAGTKLTELGYPADTLADGDLEISADKKALEQCDVVIEFSSIESTLETVKMLAPSKIPLVIGTTGFSSAQKQEISDASANMAVLMSPNMSIGVNLLFEISHLVAKSLADDYEIEIIEAHHNQKVDAPSGTAQRLKEMVLAARELAEQNVIYGRQGMPGKRPKNEVGVHAIRGGDIVGEHTVLFAGPGEKIELTHVARTRDTFASGALAAAAFLQRQKPGFYSMKDVLNL